MSAKNTIKEYSGHVKVQMLYYKLDHQNRVAIGKESGIWCKTFFIAKLHGLINKMLPLKSSTVSFLTEIKNLFYHGFNFCNITTAQSV